MRTNIVIDDQLMADAMEFTGAKTKREAVELALKALVQAAAYDGLLSLQGKVDWQGDLEAMRLD
ncbi:MAG: type II toxin-antitoxin system VapB family antitoxin [Sphingomonas sp.]|nr:type II toxin-antitoxin system VapB family antitoxin [Sphingomonas sp.]